MLRAALYARFSSDLQKPTSLADQLAACRRHAERIGADVSEALTFQDAAISGASTVGRPGLGALLEACRAGRVDVVIAEALDRLTRSGGDAWDLFDELKALGVRIDTISEGKVEELAIGLKGTMNALFLRELGIKVKRGQRGVVESGRHVSRIPYGYRRRLSYDAAGEPIRGLMDVDETEAAVIRRIAAEFLAGATGHAIAFRLNAEGVPGPRGKGWEYGAIVGRPSALRGVLRNPIYAGEIVWNRQTRSKDRRTGKTRIRDNPEADRVRQAVPELAILDAETWARVQARLSRRTEAVAQAGNPSAGNAPRRLLSGIIKCGVCGGGMNTMGTTHRYRCLARIRRGPAACSNDRTARADLVEAEVLEMLRRDLLHPETIETVVREYRSAAQARSGGARQRRAQLERDLDAATRKAERLIDQVADGELSGPTVRRKLAELEASRGRLARELAQVDASAEIVALHPTAAARYRQLVEQLQARLAPDLAAGGSATEAERTAARDALRQVVRAVRVVPLPERGKWTLDIDADLITLLGLAPPPALAARAATPTPRKAR